MSPLPFCKPLRLLIVLSLVFQILVWALPIQTSASEDINQLSVEEKNKIASQVWEDISGNQKSRFLVVLNRQVDAKGFLAGSLRDGNGVRRLVETLRKEAGDSQSEIIDLLRTRGAKYRPYWIVNLIAAEGDRTLIETLAKLGDVKSIESNRPFPIPLEQPIGLTLSAPQGLEWNISWVNAPAVWTLGFRGQNRVYANADTGVQWEHPALKSQYRGWSGTRSIIIITGGTLFMQI